MTPTRVGARRPGALLGTIGAALCLVACTSPGPGATDRGTPGNRGTVDVLYAGSLVHLMEQQLGPRFTATTGYYFAGFAGGSAELANAVKSGVRRGDVFVSASPDVDRALEGDANGRWVTGYVAFARSPLVLGYGPGSRFAAALRARPWYQVVTSPGFLLGRTDPVLDPKGQLTVQALRQTAQQTGEPALLEILAGSGTVFPEETLLGRLEAGQLDAGFLYADEAKAAGIPTVALSPVSLAATFTVAVLQHAPNEAGARSFVRFLLGSGGRRALGAAGFDVLDPPEVIGAGLANLLPTVVRS